MTAQTPKLVGTWESDPTDTTGVQSYGKVTLKFEADETLLYIIHEPGCDQVMRLKFRVEPGVIITDQPSQPRPETTAYELTSDGKLILAFGGRKSRYVRIA